MRSTPEAAVKVLNSFSVTCPEGHWNSISGMVSLLVWCDGENAPEQTGGLGKLRAVTAIVVVAAADVGGTDW
jgi:hypothetical protein